MIWSRFAIRMTVPNTKNTLVIFDPTTFEMTISVEPFKTATTDEANSGIEVPKATIVKPTKKAGNPRESPISSAASINQSDDFTRTNKLTKKTIVHKTISGILFF